MEPLTLKHREPVEDVGVEAWDDDDFANLDDVQFRAASTATSVVSQSYLTRQDSVSSRLSMRSESNQGDENWDVLVDEQAPLKDAIALAKSKGIPLPSNLPRSALEGGTIRRLRGKEIKKAIADDWSEDLDLPQSNAPLKLAKHDERDLSESLRQISAAFHTSPKTPDMNEFLNQTIRSPKSRVAAAPISLDAFKDDDDDDAFGDVPTIRVAKNRLPQKASIAQPSTTTTLITENIEEDLEIPSDGQLRLSTRKPDPRTPQQTDDFDLEWAEGSLGTRNARGRSARSSSASALSPSVSSAFTAESEDEGLDGLVLPAGPIKFEEKLKKRQFEQMPEPDFNNDRKATEAEVQKDDFLNDFDIPDGQVFDAKKLTLNRNIKHKPTRPVSPAKRTTTTLNFTTTKTQSTISRLPRFQTSHERTRSNLEPVSESGAAVSRFQRPASRLGTHSAQSSISAIPAPSTPTPSTPSKRGLRHTDSRNDMRSEPTTTNSQLLKAKRSMPLMRSLNSPTKPGAYIRPPSRTDTGSRLNLPGRPRTPTDRPDSRLAESRRGAPFLPAKQSASQSSHISLKSTQPRHYRRTDSDGSIDSMSAAQRSLSRIAAMGRPETPGRGRKSVTAFELAAGAKQQITKPLKKRDYGTGNELEVFDDLPTSASMESKFTKQPIGKGAPRSLRSRLGLPQLNSSSTTLSTSRAGTETPMPITPLSPPKLDFPTTATTITNVPRFARDTAASRNREQRQISTTFQNMRGEPLQPLSTNWKSNPLPRLSATFRKKKPQQQKPHLIKPMGNDVNRPQDVAGMHYNPTLFRWEGNENELAPFDVPDFHPRNPSPTGKGQGSPSGKANVALISNIGAGVAGVQVVGGMVFDPTQMRWLKLAPNGDAGLKGGAGSVQLEEEEDVFAGLEDLKEEDETKSRASTQHGFGGGAASRDRAISDGTDFLGGGGDGHDADAANNSGDEWPVAEEFDVGPEFVRRQRSEEEKWKRKVEKWLRKSDDVEAVEDAFGRGGWRWAIRELVSG